MEPDPLAPPPRRRHVTLTALIDVIFLLLLFFMLSSTFSRFGEIDLVVGGGGAAAAAAAPPAFLQLGEENLALNGRAVAWDGLPAAVAARGGGALVVSLREGVSAQRLADLLVALRGVANLSVTVLG